MPACPIDYPRQLPLDCLSEIVRIVRSQQVAVEKTAFAKHAWVVTGYLLYASLGDADPTPIGADLPEDDDAWCDRLAAFLDEPREPARTLPLPAKALLRWLFEKLLAAL